MYIVLFPSGKTLTFSIKALAETYVDAYGAKLVSTPEPAAYPDLRSSGIFCKIV